MHLCMVTDGNYTYHGEQLMMFTIDESLNCSSGMDIVCKLYFNFKILKKEKIIHLDY